MSLHAPSVALQVNLGDHGIQFVEHGTRAIQRLLPHVEVSDWQEAGWAQPGCVWTGTERRDVRVTITFGTRSNPAALSLTATVRRRNIPGANSVASEIIDIREHQICDLVAGRISDLLTNAPTLLTDPTSLKAIASEFDESVVSDHIQRHHAIELPVSAVLSALHTLSEQSYENKALTFGCVLDPKSKKRAHSSLFPGDFLRSKKYKALSDGFHTAYWVSTHGAVVDFVDLDRAGEATLSEKHHFPDWAEPIAKVSRKGRCGIALSRQGDILVFDEGTLRLTYRYGQWQYWNHVHLVKLLRDRAKAQRVPKQVLGRVVGAIYRVALDVSFRRSGGLFVILHNKNSLHDIVRPGDAIGDKDRQSTDASFDAVVAQRTIQSLPRSVAVELASLDGAVVLRNSGQVVAYGAVLQPKRSGKLHGSEGSRTKAAIGASNYGLAVKVSSDGDISVYHNGNEFIRV
ncbi:MAG TPA: DNA integrity scanning protein DisA nucleotide-binding domain protein [Methylibium sp.]|nr:DNA integrity scanning protein DisA nucleotide-binding domain protein [Methylibium sp.]